MYSAVIDTIEDTVKDTTKDTFYTIKQELAAYRQTKYVISSIKEYINVLGYVFTTADTYRHEPYIPTYCYPFIY